MGESITVVATAVSAIASVVSATAIVFSWRQTRLMRIQLGSDHTRSQRENAVQLVFEWAKILTKEMSAARRIAESLDDQQARSVWGVDELRLDVCWLLDVETCLESLPDSDRAGITVEGEIVHLNGSALLELKWSITRYLNLLESILTSRRHKIADQAILDEEFGYLVRPDDGKDVLAAVRRAAGGSNVLPAIEEFAREQRERQDRLPPGPPPVLPEAVKDDVE